MTDPRRKDAVAYLLPDGSQTDLDRPPEGDAQVLLQSDDLGRQVLRHSTAHVMAQAVCDLYPGAKYAIGPPVEDGFY
ncbi:MAG: threonine--tRNA ligase, partial [Actinobacteria bacterium]|nr:threonine--tRNA ligase [Actinomycetota bacterium]